MKLTKRTKDKFLNDLKATLNNSDDLAYEITREAMEGFPKYGFRQLEPSPFITVTMRLRMKPLKNPSRRLASDARVKKRVARGASKTRPPRQGPA